MWARLSAEIFFWEKRVEKFLPVPRIFFVIFLTFTREKRLISGSDYRKENEVGETGFAT